jgi:Zn-dependent protease with chaperone function
MARRPTAAREPLLAGLEGRLAPAPLPLPYALGLVVVSVAMVVLPLVYLALVAASASAAVSWAVGGLEMLTQGSLSSLRFRLVLYVVPLAALGAIPVFLVKPLFTRKPAQSEELLLERRNEPLFFAFIERLAAVVGAPVPDRVAIDCSVNAGAGLELGLLRREGGALVLEIGLPLVAGLTLRQLTGVLAHEFGHFRQGTGMRLTRLIRAVNAWFHRVVYERDDWDESLERGRDRGGWTSLGFLLAQVMVHLSRQLLFGLMVAGHGLSCFLSRQMEFDADQYGARVSGSSAFADTSLRVRLLSTASSFVVDTAFTEGRFVDDVPALVVRVADQAPPRVMAEIRLAVQRSGTRPFDTHPSDLERLQRVRAARFPGLLTNDGPAAALFRDFPGACRRATLAFYEHAIGHGAPAPDALLPVEAFVGPPPAPAGERAAVAFAFPPARPPRLAALVSPASASREAMSAARERWRKAEPAAVAAIERWGRARDQWLDACQAEALLAAGLVLDPREFSLPTATPEGVERTRARALAMQGEADSGLEAAERALAERVSLALGALAGGLTALTDAAALSKDGQRLLAALPALEQARVEGDALQGQGIAVDCLLGNQTNRMGHAGLNEEIHRRLPQLRQRIDAVRTALETLALPGPPWDIPPPWRDDPASHTRSARRALEVLEGQHARAVARLVELADRVEAALG